MTLSMIDQLRNLSAEERPLLLQEIYQNNMQFFEKYHPALLALVQRQKCPYELNLTPDFLTITHEKTGELAHPEAGLDMFAMMMGDWVHSAWIELFNFRVVAPEQYPLHNRPLKELHRDFMTGFPEYPILFARRQINLKELDNDKRFSPPVIFLGVFHGLHIDYFLSRTEVAFMLFVEPDLARFEVSCYFLDYERIREEIGSFLFAIGPDIHAAPIQSFFSNYHVSRHMWVRVLPGYEHPRNPHLLESFKMNQTSQASVIFPIDHEIAGIQHAVANLRRQFPLLTRPPKLSRKSRIAIVASGPSLDNDLDWLHKNSHKLIIFAVQSAVKPLRRHGIVPDFQFSMETMMKDEILHSLDLYPEKPLIAYLKAPETITGFSDNILLCGTSDKASPVRLTCPVQYVSPSTTNLAFSFACLCRPGEIYLLGCDFGYLKLENHHASGTFHDKTADGSNDKKNGYLAKMSQVIMEANFAGTATVQSTPFLSHTRIAVEESLAASEKDIRVFNLSDGAKVKGTRSKRSKQLKLKRYDQKKKDCLQIRGAFRPAEKEVNWSSYRIEADTILETLKTELINRLRLDDFSWREFNLAMDWAVQNALTASQEDEKDRRLDIYARFLVDALSMWYSTLIFFDDIKKAEDVYAFGLEKITEIIRSLRWPAERLD